MLAVSVAFCFVAKCTRVAEAPATVTPAKAFGVDTTARQFVPPLLGQSSTDCPNVRVVSLLWPLISAVFRLTVTSEGVVVELCELMTRMRKPAAGSGCGSGTVQSEEQPTDSALPLSAVELTE